MPAVPENGYRLVDDSNELNTYVNVRADIRDVYEFDDLHISTVIIEDYETSIPMKCAILGEYQNTIPIQAVIEEYAVAEIQIGCKILADDKGIAYSFIT